MPSRSGQSEVDRDVVVISRVNDEHRRHVTAWWCEVFGGPARYTAELGGYERMVAKHRGCPSPRSSASDSLR